MAVFDLVTPEAWAAHAASDTRVIVDARAAADYWQGHLPQARHLDPAVLALFRTDAASLTRFQALLVWALSSLGITRTTPVLVLGAQNDTPGAKVAWALAYAGVQRVSLLDGGLAGWTGELTQAAPSVAPARYEPDFQSAYLASAQDVLAASQQGGLVLDARSREEFDGQRSNAGRPGRVPGAVFWDVSRELDGTGRYAEAATVARQAETLGASPQAPTLIYCGGGGRAARAFVALQLAGKAASVYPASWLEWGVDPQYPVQNTAS